MACLGSTGCLGPPPKSKRLCQSWEQTAPASRRTWPAEDLACLYSCWKLGIRSHENGGVNSWSGLFKREIPLEHHGQLSTCHQPKIRVPFIGHLHHRKAPPNHRTLAQPDHFLPNREPPVTSALGFSKGKPKGHPCHVLLCFKHPGRLIPLAKELPLNSLGFRGVPPTSS